MNGSRCKWGFESPHPFSRSSYSTFKEVVMFGSSSQDRKIRARLEAMMRASLEHACPQPKEKK